MLEARELSRRFGRRWAVRRVSARFEAGTLSCVTGNNGAGKSTLMGMLSGALRPTDGEALAFGVDVHAPSGRGELRRRIAWLGHRPAVYEDLSGEENLRFWAGIFGVEVDPLPLLARVGLAAAGHRPARTYSRGMMQRLALARVLAQEAELWLLDEPSTGLDRSGRALLLELLGEAKQAGRALVVVTHDPAALESLTDQTCALDKGRRAAP